MVFSSKVEILLCRYKYFSHLVQNIFEVVLSI